MAERPGLDATQLERYARQIVLDGVGPAGQARLVDGRVLVVGAGGLGSPVVQYLAAAGVGTLGVADGDVVERSNLQRQVLHGEADVGRPKTESARAFVADLNPGVTVETHDRVTPANAADIVPEYDVVVDASDNIPTRYLVNDACTIAGVPLVYGAVYRFEGQAATFLPRPESPCYRCLFPEAPPADAVPDCATAGVLGAVPGVVGTVQASEALKLRLDVGDPLDGRLLAVDVAAMSFDEVPVRPDPDCPVCGDDPTITDLSTVDYAGSCVP
ncbi:MAG: ThiF family adenylyltransferase [Halobacteriaceae archaeon]